MLQGWCSFYGTGFVTHLMGATPIHFWAEMTGSWTERHHL